MKEIKWTIAFVLITTLLASSTFAKDQLRPLTIQLNWATNVQFAGVLLAKKRGWYENAGIGLTIKGWKIGILPIDEVTAGKAQIGVAEGDTLIKGGVKGNAIKAIATQFQRTPFCIMSKKSLGIKTPEQLKGKKIGINSTAVVMTKIVLASKGLGLEDIITVSTGWDVQPLIKDKIDAYVGFMNDQPLTIKEKGYELNVIPAFKHGYDFYSGIFFVTDTIIQNQPELIQAFLNVTMRGWREAFKTPHETAKMIVAEYYHEGSVRQQTESLKIFHALATIGIIAIGDSMIGIMDKDYWQKGVDILHKFNQIDKKIPAEDLFTLKFVKNTFTSKLSKKK
ncbi:ABC transporter substrate-binding protein [Desulfococcaceae bacterium HSG7]|nr:ABC transporter substrate-binding protein [Desulfococcaceae bacterium HSG7]